MRILVSIIAILIWLTPSTALAAKPNLDLTSEQVESLQEILCGWKTTNQLLAEDLVSNAEALKIKDSYTTKLKSIIPDFDVSNTDFTELIKYQNDTNNFKQRLKGLFSFTKIVATVSSILLAIAIGWLIRLYLLPLMRLIPLVVYESISYAIISAIIVAGYWQNYNDIYQYVLLSGCLSLIGMLSFSSWHHKYVWKKFCRKIGLDILSLCALILFLIWSAVAVAYQNVAIAFLAVAALEAFSGFAVAVMPLTYIIGFRNRAVIPRTMILSLLLLIIYVIAQITNTTLPYLDIFAPGVKYISCFVYFIGLLIVSSKWYFRKNLNLYLLMQGLTVISGVIALYVSSVWQISVLKGIGGTLLALYAIEKYCELPWTKRNLAWATFGLSIILYGCAWLIRSYPELFLIS